MHIPIRLKNKIDPKGRIKTRDNNRDDFKSLKFNLEYFKENPIGFNGILVISVNGFIDDIYKNEIKWLDQNVVNKQWGDWTTTIFQRPNWGYQWGGFYDTWLKYKDIDCTRYATLECDCYLHGEWFKKGMRMLADHPDFGFVGMAPDKNVRKNLRVQYHFSDRLWEKHSGYKHTRGGFYLCRKRLLEAIDKEYGCFTLSMGANQDLDGIACGEIGFSSKTRHLGFKYSVLNPSEVYVQK